MANIKSAKKRILVTAKKTEFNRAKKSELNTYIKKYKAKPSKELLAEVTSLLDKAAQDNLIHVNKANRIKAKLASLCA
jgi:small subunit ribosomal protein S20